MFWHRKPVTHAVVLWVLVGMAAGALISVLAYASLLSSLRNGAVEARPPKGPGGLQQQPPTRFGTVVEFDGRVVKMESTQAYDELIVEADTTITTVGGSPVPASELKPGTVLTATGSDLGDRRLSAVAIVILEAR